MCFKNYYIYNTTQLLRNSRTVYKKLCMQKAAQTWKDGAEGAVDCVGMGDEAWKLLY